MGGVIRVALAGYGLAGSVFHAPLLAGVPGMKLSAIAARSKADAARKDFPGVEIFGEPSEILAQADKFDLLVIATPNNIHAPLAIAAMEAGLSVIIDKPAALSTAELNKVIAVRDEHGSFLSIFQNRRYDGDFLTVREIVENERIGPIYRFESRFERYRTMPKSGGWRETTKPEDGGGILLDLGSHLIDQAACLFGRPISVFAEVMKRRPAVDGDDDVFVALEFPGEIQVHLWMNMLAAAPGPRFRLLGLDGAYEKWGLDGQEEALRKGLRPGCPGWNEAIIGVGNDAASGKLYLSSKGSSSAAACAGERAAVGATAADLKVEELRVKAGNYPAYYESISQCLFSRSDKNYSRPAGGGGLPVNPVTAEEVLVTMKIIELARESAAVRRALPMI